MPEPNHKKEILIPTEAGLVTMERYGLSCESRYNWSDPQILECAERIKAAHAPYEMEIKGKKYRINIASGNDKFRNYSLKVLQDYILGVKNAPHCIAVVAHPAPHFWSEDAGRPCETRQVGEYSACAITGGRPH